MISNTIDTGFFSVANLIKIGLPPLPTTVVQVSSLLADMNVSQNAIAKAISIDPIISSRILRMANSPIYALHGTVTNLASAVSTVGNAAISDLIMMSGVSDSFGRKVLNSPAGKKIWFHSLATAMVGSEICRVAQLRGADEAFSCGLLHDIGKLILLRADAPLYTEVMALAACGGNITEIEQEMFGFDHAELGAAAAVSWKLPSAVSHMIRFHHEPMKATAGVAMANVISLADRFVTIMSAAEDPSDFYRSDIVSRFQLNPEQLETVWDNVSVRLDEAIETFL
jgi:putative nucleotidyltransferase with HDIG domain